VPQRDASCAGPERSCVGCRCGCHALRCGASLAAACRQGVGEIGRPLAQFHAESVLRSVRCRHNKLLAT